MSFDGTYEEAMRVKKEFDEELAREQERQRLEKIQEWLKRGRSGDSTEGKDSGTA